MGKEDTLEDELSSENTLRELAQRVASSRAENYLYPTSDSLGNAMKLYQMGGNVNLLNRPKVSAEAMRKAGYLDFNGDYATVYTHGFSNRDNTKYANFTPIMANGRVLSPEHLQNYAESVLNGREKDYLGLQIGKEFNNQIAADKAAERIHELQEMYYSNHSR